MSSPATADAPAENCSCRPAAARSSRRPTACSQSTGTSPPRFPRSRPGRRRGPDDLQHRRVKARRARRRHRTRRARTGLPAPPSQTIGEHPRRRQREPDRRPARRLARRRPRPEHRDLRWPSARPRRSTPTLPSSSRPWPISDSTATARPAGSWRAAAACAQASPPTRPPRRSGALATPTPTATYAHRRGWSARRYRRWLTHELSAALLTSAYPPSTASAPGRPRPRTR